MINLPIKPRTLLAVFTLALVAMLAPAGARADQYVVDHCRNWDTDAAGVAFPTVTGATSDSCGAGGQLFAQVAGAVMAFNSTVTISLTIPADRPNISIERVQSQYSAPASVGGSDAFLMMEDPSAVLQDTMLGPAPVTPILDALLPPGVRTLSWATYCSFSLGATNCSLGSEFVLGVIKTRLYLNEAVNPTLAVTGGTLMDPGSKAGQASLAFDAHDTDSGVSSVSVSLGATIVGSVKYACAFTDWSACQRDRAGQLLEVDTTKVPDGPHELLVTVRDAANNALTRSLGTITVANAPPAPAPAPVTTPAPGSPVPSGAAIVPAFGISGVAIKNGRLRWLDLAGISAGSKVVVCQDKCGPARHVLGSASHTRKAHRLKVTLTKHARVLHGLTVELRVTHAGELGRYRRYRVSSGSLPHLISKGCLRAGSRVACA